MATEQLGDVLRREYGPRIGPDEIRRLQSALTNANNTSQWLRAQLIEMQQTLGRQQLEISELTKQVTEVISILKEKGLV